MWQLFYSCNKNKWGLWPNVICLVMRGGCGTIMWAETLNDSQGPGLDSGPCNIAGTEDICYARSSSVYCTRPIWKDLFWSRLSRLGCGCTTALKVIIDSGPALTCHINTVTKYAVVHLHSCITHCNEEYSDPYIRVRGLCTLLCDQQCYISEREAKRLEREEKEAICVNLEQPSLNRMANCDPDYRLLTVQSWRDLHGQFTPSFMWL